jgi:hypothetical protein
MKNDNEIIKELKIMAKALRDKKKSLEEDLEIIQKNYRNQIIVVQRSIISIEDAIKLLEKK